MIVESDINDFLSFIKSLFFGCNVRIEQINERFVTVDIAPGKSTSKGLVIFITPEDIAISIVEQDLLREDSFMPFEKRIPDFTEAKGYLSKWRNDEHIS